MKGFLKLKKFLAMMLTFAMLFVLAACGGGGNEQQGQQQDQQQEDAQGTEQSGGGQKGSVYYLNFKPESNDAWQALAKQYTAETGVPVEVLTAASGEYNNTLTAQMGKSRMPTLFQCGNMQSLLDWGDYCLDLTGSKVLGEMTTTDFNLVEHDEVKAIGYCYEAFGIIVNKALLAKAGYTLDDITDFDSLKKVAEDIHARKGELGFDAFSSAGLESSSSWRFSGHLANMPLYYEFRDNGVTTQPSAITGEYLDNYRAIWDLYIDNSSTEKTSLTTATGDMSIGEFTSGKAVFFQNGTWEYANLTKAGMNPEDLAMIPIYCGVDGEEDAGLCCGTENCWAVNSKASREDIQATLDFLYWVVTSDAGTEMMAREFGPIPFKRAKQSENVFFNDANEYISNGNYTVTWAFNHTPNVDSWRSTVVSALAAYSAEKTNANWDKVTEAFVDGWAYEYSMQNG